MQLWRKEKTSSEKTTEEMNCLTRALDQWNENREEFRLWYNGNHVVSLEGCYEEGIMIEQYCPTYLPLSEYGLNYFLSSFDLMPDYIELLKEYLKQE